MPQRFPGLRQAEVGETGLGKQRQRVGPIRVTLHELFERGNRLGPFQPPAVEPRQEYRDTFLLRSTLPNRLGHVERLGKPATHE